MKNTSDLEELLDAGIISADTANRIRAYWQHKQAQQPNRLTLVFSLLGALLVGLGIILVVAHNWDQIGRLGKTVIAFIPLLIGQLAAWYTLQKKPESQAWREGSGVFLTLAVGACLAMVSQIYHIEGELSDFLLGWIWLALPIMYILDATLASLLFWAGITWYAGETGYWSYPRSLPGWYWLMALAAIPYYFRIRRLRPQSNGQVFHDWVIPLSLLFCLATLVKGGEALVFIDYQLLLLGYYFLGKLQSYEQQRIANNGWLLIGLLGSVGMLLAQSFRDFWRYTPSDWEFASWQSREFLIFVVLFLLFGLLITLGSRKDRRDILLNPLTYLGAILFGYYWLGWNASLMGTVLANLVLLVLGLYHILLGTRRDNLVILNFGLLIITAQITCRFFDTDLSFAWRGLLFLLLGAGFFATNSYLLRRRQQNTTTNE